MNEQSDDRESKQVNDFQVADFDRKETNTVDVETPVFDKVMHEGKLPAKKTVMTGKITPDFRMFQSQPQKVRSEKQ